MHAGKVLCAKQPGYSLRQAVQHLTPYPATQWSVSQMSLNIRERVFDELSKEPCVSKVNLQATLGKLDEMGCVLVCVL